MLPLLGIVHGARVNMVVYVALQILALNPCSFGYILRSGMAGSDACILRDKKFTGQTSWEGCAKQREEQVPREMTGY